MKKIEIETEFVRVETYGGTVCFSVPDDFDTVAAGDPDSEEYAAIFDLIKYELNSCELQQDWDCVPDRVTVCRVIGDAAPDAHVALELTTWREVDDDAAWQW